MTSLPKIPYSDAELELFARLHLRTTRGNQLQIAQPDEVQIRDFMRLMKQLPPWQQVLAVELRLPNLMGDSEALRTLHTKTSSRNEDVLGLFVPKPAIPDIEPLTVSWGGTFETRNRNGNDGKAPDLTYLHEAGHRVDMIVGTKPTSIRNRTMSDMRYRSSLPFWANPVQDYVQVHAGANYAGDGPKGRPLYRGARSLIVHLCSPKADGTPFYTPANHPTEAMAELLCSYSALYTKYSGHHRAIAQELHTAYPTLWKPLDQHIISDAISQAERLYARRESACRNLLTLAAAQSKKDGYDFDAGEAAPAIRLLAVQHGLEPLTKIADSFKIPRSRRPSPVVEPIGRMLEGLCTPNIRTVMNAGRRPGEETALFR